MIAKACAPVIIALAVTTGLAGCSNTPPSADVPSATDSPSDFDGAIPSFTGPWAAEFADAYRTTTSDALRQILAKESVTDQDYATISGLFVTCMANKGFTVHIEGPAGEMTIQDVSSQADTDRARAASDACDSGFSTISALRGSIVRNPQKLDENTIVAACLVGKKVAHASYTAKDYARDLEKMTFPFSKDSSGFSSCTGDPLGLDAAK